MDHRLDPYRAMIDNIPTLAWCCGPDGAAQFVNRQWLDYTGLSMDEALGWGWKVSIHPDDAGKLMDTWVRLLGSGEPGAVEGRMLRVDGVYRWFQFRVSPVRNEQGKIDRWYGTLADIEDLKRAEGELRRSAAYLAEAQRLSHTGTLGWKVSTGELYWSEETYRIYQVDPKVKPTIELVMKMIHPDDLARVQKTCACAAQDGKDYTHKYRIVLPDGSLRSLHIEAHSTIDTSGNIEYVGAVMDVSERKKAEQTLQASKHLARGQLNALTRTLDALASDSQPDNFLEHVLRTITQQFDAHGTSVWRRQTNGSICFEAAVENGKLITKSTPDIAAIGAPLPIENIWPYPEQLRAATPSVMEDIREAPDSQWCNRLQRQGVVTILLAPMMIARRVEGAIGIRFTRKRTFRNDEIELARALAHQALLAMQLMKLSMQSRQTAVLAERNRLARDMHDVLAQGFTGVIVQLEAAEDANSKGLPKAAAEHIERAAEMARYGLREARRSVHALRPLALNENHICAAMQELLENMTAGTKLRSAFTPHGIPRQLPALWEDHLLRIEQEALTNTIKHAHADHFSAVMYFEAAGLRFELRDDGSGFDGITEHGGLGLLGIKERVEEMGGKLTIASAPGKGTQISVHVPLPSQDGNGTNSDD
jgi:PAS domain S-box-containing protein